MNDNKNIKERISALADGELSEFETRRILSEISENPDYREFWRNIHLTKDVLSPVDNDFLESDVSRRLHPNLMKKKLKFSSKEKAKKPRLSYFIASSVGFIAVVFYSLLPETENSFASYASNEIIQAIESPSALDVLNGSVQGLDVILQDYKTGQNGTLANYRFPSSGKTFKVSLYPMQEINKINLSEAAKISYIKSDKGVYVVSVTGDISTDKKNQILQKANIFADKLN